MTTKEKVLKFYPDAKVTGYAMIRIISLAAMKVLSGWYASNEEEAAWQNAAESLPAEAEQKLGTCVASFVPHTRGTYCIDWTPVAHVEAKEKEPELYYIQDKRSYCGNSCFWWKPDGNGYTCNLDEAWKVTREKAESMMRHRPGVDVAWPVAVIDAGTARHFDMQQLREIKPP